MARESVQSRISDYKERVRNLDFVSRSEDRVYYDLVDLPAALTHEIFERHHGIFDERKTFVRHWSDLISGTWASSLETKIRKAVSERYPVVAEPQSSADSRHELPSLVVMVRGAKKEHFQTLGDDGTYQFVSHGHILQVSAKERDIILSLPQSLFEPDDQDLAREKQSIESVLTDTRMRTEEVQKVVDRGHQLITKLEERHSDICKYEDDLSASPGLNVPSESAVPPEAAVPPEPDVPSNQPQIREDSLANSCLFDPRGDIERESPEKAGTIVADALTPPNPHEEPTLGPAANISTTGTSSVIPLREVEGNTERGNRKSVGTRNAKKLKTGSTYRDVPSADSDPFNNFSDSTEAGEDTPPMSLVKKRPHKCLGQRGPNRSEKEKKDFYQFIHSRRQKDLEWEHVVAEYNIEFGTNRTEDTLKRYMTRENTDRNKKGIPPGSIRAQRTGGAFGAPHASPGQHRLNGTSSARLNVEVLADGQSDTLH